MRVHDQTKFEKQHGYLLHQYGSVIVNPSDGQLGRRTAPQANATAVADTIVFSAAFEGGSLILTQGELSPPSDITIDDDLNDDRIRINFSGSNNARFCRAKSA